MPNGRVAMSAVLGTVTEAANSVTALVSAGTKGIGMIDAMVTKASGEQRKRYVSASMLFDEQLKLDYARDVTTLKTDADTFCDKSTRHKELFNAAYAEIENALNPNTQAEA